VKGKDRKKGKYSRVTGIKRAEIQTRKRLHGFPTRDWGAERVKFPQRERKGWSKKGGREGRGRYTGKKHTPEGVLTKKSPSRDKKKKEK